MSEDEKLQQLAELEKDGDEIEEIVKNIDDEDLKKSLLTENARKKHWRDKFSKSEENRKTLEEEIERLRQDNEKNPKKQVDDDISNKIKKLEEIEEKRQFGYKYNYSPEETDYIWRQATGTGKKPDEIVEDPFVMGGINSLREKQQLEKATPKPGAGGLTFENKTWGELSKEDKQKHYSDVWKK